MFPENRTRKIPTPTPTQECSLSLILVEILEAMHVRGKVALIDGYIIYAYSFLDRVHVGIGYFNLTEICTYNTVHSSLGDLLSIINFSTQSIATNFNSLIIFLLPFRAIYIPSISEVMLHLSLSKVTLVPSEVKSTRSRFIYLPPATQFPCFQT